MVVPVEPVIVIISREDVENLDINPTVDVLRSLVERESEPTNIRGRLQLGFHGFDSDSRELWDVSEVRTFVRALDAQFPYWFFLVDLRSETLKLLVFCLCRTSRVLPGATAVHPGDLQAFLETHFSAMNQLLDHWRMSEDENEHVTNEIVDYFERSEIMN